MDRTKITLRRAQYTKSNQRHTTPNLDITVGLITAGFVRTGSDVPSLPVMILKMKKMISAGLKPVVSLSVLAKNQQ